MNTIWFFTEKAKGKALDRALFSNPCVRIRCLDSTGTQHIEPWTLPGSCNFILKAGATVMEPAPNGPGELRSAGNYPLEAFLSEVFSGRRRWRSAWELHGSRAREWGKYAGWVLEDDFERVLRERTRSRTAMRRRVPEPQGTLSTGETCPELSRELQVADELKTHGTAERTRCDSPLVSVVEVRDSRDDFSAGNSTIDNELQVEGWSKLGPTHRTDFESRPNAPEECDTAKPKGFSIRRWWSALWRRQF